MPSPCIPKILYPTILSKIYPVGFWINSKLGLFSSLSMIFSVIIYDMFSSLKVFLGWFKSLNWQWLESFTIWYLILICFDNSLSHSVINLPYLTVLSITPYLSLNNWETRKIPSTSSPKSYIFKDVKPSFLQISITW